MTQQLGLRRNVGIQCYAINSCGFFVGTIKAKNVREAIRESTAAGWPPEAITKVKRYIVERW